ncbi:transcriptional regulator with XRE-family HTH domain [Catenulispora sp. GAS73]|uniref:helix-turn-helix domain-containing protein n=1 Tax=Catenulispora sp. GAS73 TaxID=3156269 RepID=UPI003516D786
MEVSRSTDIVAQEPGSRARTLQVDDTARLTYGRVIGHLRSARTDADLSQNALAEGLPFRGRAISEWETGAVEPTLEHLMQLAHKLDSHLVILGLSGDLRSRPIRRRAGEPWHIFEQRRLALPLRNRRSALGLSQDALGFHVGVSRDSIQRWELARVPPRPMALIVWAQKLGYTLAMQPIDNSKGGPGTGSRFQQLEHGPVRRPEMRTPLTT